MHPFTKWLQNRQGNASDGHEYAPHNGSGHVYLRNKQIKLDNQAKDSIDQTSRIFGGCVVYITGYTVPSAAALKKLIVGNGGQLCAFLGGKTYATHIIASSLTSRKREQYRNYTVVKPAWVVDSVNAGKRLDWTNYNIFNSNDVEITEISEEESDTEPPCKEPLPHQLSPDQLPEPLVPPPVTLHPLPQQDIELRSSQIQWIVSQRSRVDCTNPGFLKEYFGNSRLHFLSTQKLVLRRRCRQYMAEVRAATSAAPPQAGPVKRTLLHIDFDSFFVAVALKKRPDLRDAPVCVSHGGDGSDVASCNYVARKSGVSNGMWVSRARELCPNLVCLPYDFEEYKLCSNGLYDVLLSVKPQSITAISVDEAILDVSSVIQGSATELCSSIRSLIRNRTGIEASAGVGSNVLLAKLALRMSKPAGQREISGFNEVLDMNVDLLPGVGSQTALKLNELGCTTIGDLQKVPLVTLQNELGSAMGHKIYGYALGSDTSDVEKLDVPVQSVGMDIGWGVRVINKEEKDQFVLACAAELFNRIEQADLPSVPGQFTVKVHRKHPQAPFITKKYMGHGHCEITSKSQTIPPKLTLEQLQQTARELVSSISCEPLDFRGLGLHVKIKSGTSRATNNTLHNYFTLAPSDIPHPLLVSPTRSPQRKQMYAVPPRKKAKRFTLTQMVQQPPSSVPLSHDDIDMSVLAELPEHIQQEILRDVQPNGVVGGSGVNPGTVNPVPALAPLYSNPAFIGLQGKELRYVLQDWINSTESPSLEDIQQFYTYACDAVRRSRWCDVLDLIDWLQYLCQPHGKWRSDDWRIFYETLDGRIQQLASSRVTYPTSLK